MLCVLSLLDGGRAEPVASLAFLAGVGGGGDLLGEAVLVVLPFQFLCCCYLAQRLVKVVVVVRCCSMRHGHCDL